MLRVTSVADKVLECPNYIVDLNTFAHRQAYKFLVIIT